MADGSVTVRFTLPFKRRFKSLAKRYRQIQQDIQPMIEQLQSGVFLGDQISGTDYTVFKVRVKNSDIPVGKSGGYRVISQVLSPDALLLLLIYAKSDQADVTTAEIEAAVVEAIHES
ncbi:MAG: type II toxin-antitoxin system RelE/ParE family toxin [Pegethrix bostrychoides GSE-TBD4-15B]|uniref:Type II toxin-antitoxin system RelE/ParE family toxin n=1 Tax=Pegethrix bostrychoides GSE-TBD4-15B TaxID=2839662 RepID=A0A951U3B9_9CYAN|nr:type II toxin-antitoxin system RelE/ParE family toxin [Pegethrix bostrychoides GSE-TBD4-15B]